MNRLPAVAAAALLAGLALTIAPPVSTATPFTNAFFGLQTEMESRRDGEYAGEDLTKEQKKELKAILKALKAIAKPADDVGDDIKTGGKVAKTLEKAFPGEFAATGAPVTLGSRMRSALDFLHAIVISDYLDLEDRMGRLVDEKAIAGIEKTLLDAQEGFDDYEAALTMSKSTKGLQGAYQAVVKGNKIADGADGGEVEEPSLTAAINAVAFEALAPTAVIVTAGDGLRIIGTDGAFPAAHRTINLLVAGVTGPGTYNVLTPGSSGGLQEFAQDNGTPVLYPATSGSLTVSVYDPPNRVAGIFSFSATAPAARSVTNGVFEITSITVE